MGKVIYYSDYCEQMLYDKRLKKSQKDKRLAKLQEWYANRKIEVTP